MSGTTTAMCVSFKSEIAQALHNFVTSTGNVFGFALIKTSPTGTYSKASTNYSNITGNSDEVANGNGYTTGGFMWTAAQNTTPAAGTTGSYWSWSVNPNWTGSGAGFSASAGMIYNSTSGNRAVGVFDFGGTVTVGSGSTLTLTLPANAEGTSILQIN